jgi:hypothetical protein
VFAAMETPDMIENGPAPDDADRPATRSRISQLTRDLFSTEPLAVGAFALALLSGIAATTGSFPFGLPTVLIGQLGSEHQWWFLLPILIPAGLAFIAGIAGVWVSTPTTTARWPRALAGGGAFLSFGVIALTLIVWATQPDIPGPFDQL